MIWPDTCVTDLGPTGEVVPGKQVGLAGCCGCSLVMHLTSISLPLPSKRQPNIPVGNHPPALCGCPAFCLELHGRAPLGRSQCRKPHRLSVSSSATVFFCAEGLVRVFRSCGNESYCKMWFSGCACKRGCIQLQFLLLESHLKMNLMSVKMKKNERQQRMLVGRVEVGRNV